MISLFNNSYIHIYYFPNPGWSQNKSQILFVIEMLPESDPSFKKKRQSYSVAIRRTRREALISQRRDMIGEGIQIHQSLMSNTEDKTFKESINLFLDAKYEISQLESLANLLTTGSILEKHQGIIGIRKILCEASNNLNIINRIIEIDIVSNIIECIQQIQYLSLKLQAVWVLSNMTTGTAEHCMVLDLEGVIDELIGLINQNQNQLVVEHAIWGLANFSAQSISYRDDIIGKDAVSKIMKIFSRFKSLQSLSNVAWAVSNICRGHPKPNYSLVSSAQNIFFKAISLNAINDAKILSDCLWAVSALSQGSQQKIQALIDSQIIETILLYALDKKDEISIPSVFILNNIASGNEVQISYLIDHGILSLIMNLLDNPKKILRRQVCCILSNINLYYPIIAHEQQLMKKLLKQLSEDPAVDVKVAIAGVCVQAGLLHLNNEEIVCFYEQIQIIRHIGELLELCNSSDLSQLLEGFEKVLSTCVEINSFAIQFRRQGKLEYLQKLTNHPSTKIQSEANYILDKYFNL